MDIHVHCPKFVSLSDRQDNNKEIKTEKYDLQCRFWSFQGCVFPRVCIPESSPDIIVPSRHIVGGPDVP